MVLVVLPLASLPVAAHAAVLRLGARLSLRQERCLQQAARGVPEAHRLLVPVEEHVVGHQCPLLEVVPGSLVVLEP